MSQVRYFQPAVILLGKVPLLFYYSRLPCLYGFATACPILFICFYLRKTSLNLKMGMIEQLPDTLNLRFTIMYLRLCVTNHNILFPCVGFSASIWKLIITRMSLYIVIIVSVQKLCEYSYITLKAHLILPGMFLPICLDPHLVFVCTWILDT